MKISVETFRALDESLSEQMGRTWTKQYTRLVQLVARGLDRNDQQLIDDAINQFDLRKVFLRHRKTAELIGMASVFFGASQLGTPDKSSFKGKSVPEQVRASLSQLEVMMGELTEQVRKAARQVVSDDRQAQHEESQRITVQKVSSARVRGFTSFANRKVGKAGFTGIQIASGLHTSRLSAWGFTTEARLKGISHYRVDEQLDGRTCPVCRTMNGKVFPVEPAHGRLNTILQEKDTQALKILAPWPKQDRASVKALGGMKPEELSSRGWDTPPYHPLCRGVLQPVKGRPSVEIPGAGLTPGTRRVPVDRAPVDPRLSDEIVDSLTTGSTAQETADSLGVALAVVLQVQEDRDLDL